MGYFVYFLRSRKDGSLYIGQTNNLKNRLERHNKGLVKSTKGCRPFELIYLEKFKNRREAMYREWVLKSTDGIAEKKKILDNLST